MNPVKTAMYSHCTVTSLHKGSIRIKLYFCNIYEGINYSILPTYAMSRVTINF